MTQCRFVTEQGLGIKFGEPHAKLLNAVTGWNLSPKDLEEIAERTMTLERAFNCREG